ncbi:MAG: FtsW/RodA/SpoVE family cell cycle protein [Phycisphaerales bacterium]|nr:FtsW/RodA/SpoVE family cell cycle protein [Phycisphaerales bacterium]
MIVLALLTFGVVMVHSADLRVTTDPQDAETLMSLALGRTTIHGLLAVMALLAGAMFPVRQLFERRGISSPIPWIVLAILVTLPLAYVPGIGVNINGAHRWAAIGPVGFQPSELAKWGILIVLAWYCARRAGALSSFRYGVLPPVLVVGALAGFIAIEDLGTAVLIGVVAALILLAAGVRFTHLLAFAPAAIIGFVLFVLREPYRRARLTAFLDPFGDPEDTGFHVIQSMSAINAGGLAGRGLGNGLKKYGELPESTSDFIFSVICEELGAIGPVAIIFLYAAILFVGLMILERHPRPFQRLLALGILLTFGVQAIINLFVVTGMAPTKGIALPLVSSGGTGWIVCAFFLGILFAMEREADQMDPLLEDLPADARLRRLAIRVTGRRAARHPLA